MEKKKDAGHLVGWLSNFVLPLEFEWMEAIIFIKRTIF